MSRIRHGALAILSTLPALVVACSIDDRMLTVDAAPPPPKGIVLISDGEGLVSGPNVAGINGYWYVNSDAIEPGYCLDVGFTAAQCSTVDTPPHDHYAFVPPDPSKICTSGAAAKVIANPSTMALDYEHIWGTNLGLDFNNMDRTNVNRGGTWDAPANGITGFSFVIDTPPGSIRVSFSTDAAPYKAAYWSGAKAGASPVKPGLNVVRWADVGGPMYVTNPPLFDPTQIRGIQFTVVSNATQSIPFDFCISELTALTE
jgi:hypothetical protein